MVVAIQPPPITHAGSPAMGWEACTATPSAPIPTAIRFAFKNVAEFGKRQPIVPPESRRPGSAPPPSSEPPKSAGKPATTPVRNHLGEVVGYAHTVRNDSQLEEDEQARQRLTAIMQSSPDAVVFIDLHGFIQTWNPAAKTMFGYDDHEIIDQHVATLLPDGLEHDEEKTVDRLKKGEIIRIAETQRRRKSGRLVPVALTGAPVLNNMGEVIGASLLMRDLGERAESERLRGHLAAIVAMQSAAILTTDCEDIIRTWNSAAEKLFGYTADEIIGHPHSRLMPADQFLHERSLHCRLCSGGTAIDYQTFRIRKDGGTTPVRLHARAIKGTSDETIGVCFISV